MKKVFSLALVLLMSVVLSIPALAALQSTTLSDGWEQYSWSPTITDVRYDASGGRFRVVSYFEWDSDNVNTVFDIPSDLYYTMEHNNPNNNGTASISGDDLYSNLPYAEYDVDDDEGDGYIEELEVTCYSSSDPEPLTANATYFFDTTWHNPAYPSKSMYCAVRSQRSMYSILTGEMQAHATDFHGRTPSYLIGKETRSNDVSNDYESAALNDENKTIVIPSVESDSDTRIRMQEQQVQLEQAVGEEDLAILKNAKITVTFAEPLDTQTVDAILQDANADMERCTLKYEDENGNRITGWTDDVSAEHLQEKLEYLRSVHGNVTYAGIVSANITMDLTDSSAYESLVNNPTVYYADASEPIIRVTEKDYEGNLHVKVLDASWEVEACA